MLMLVRPSRYRYVLRSSASAEGAEMVTKSQIGSGGELSSQRSHVASILVDSLWTSEEALGTDTVAPIFDGNQALANARAKKCWHRTRLPVQACPRSDHRANTIVRFPLEVIEI